MGFEGVKIPCIKAYWLRNGTCGWMLGAST